jgi:Rho GDP-dissociation inhibitor
VPAATAAGSGVNGDEDGLASTYVAPKKVTIDELMQKDSADSSLAKYKASLLGGGGSGGSGAAGESATAKFPSDPRVVVMHSMSVLVEGRPPIVVDLSGADLSTLKSNPYTLKEGVNFSIVLAFYVQHDLVHGLRWHNNVSSPPSISCHRREKQQQR